MLETLANRETSESAELCHRVKSFLQMQHIPALRKLEVEADNDTVKIHGEVGTYYERQIAIECCKRVAGVRSVVDHVHVSVSISERNQLKTTSNTRRRPR